MIQGQCTTLAAPANNRLLISPPFGAEAGRIGRNKSEISVMFVVLSHGKFSWLPGLRKATVGCCSIAAGDSSQKP